MSSDISRTENLRRDKPCHDAAAEQSSSFEAALAQIEAIVHDLEDGKVGLADALGRYEQGVKLLRQCYGLLEKAERRIELLIGVDSAGNPIAEPFDDAASTERDPTNGGPTAARSRKRTARPTKMADEAPAAPPVEPPEVDEPGSLF